MTEPTNNGKGSRSYRQVKRVAIGVVGGTVVLLGIILIFIPGPAFLVIPAGLAILATEFAWAKSWLEKAKKMATRRGRAGGDDGDRAEKKSARGVEGS